MDIIFLHCNKSVKCISILKKIKSIKIYVHSHAKQRQQHTHVHMSRKTTPLHTYIQVKVTLSSLKHVAAMQTAPATPPSLAFFKGVIDGETGGWVVVGVSDGDSGQQLAGPGGGVAAVEGVHCQVVVHPQCYSVQLLNNKPVNPTVTSLVTRQFPQW